MTATSCTRLSGRARMEAQGRPEATEIPVELRYDARDPYAVTFLVGPHAVRWVFSRDLLAAGRHGIDGPGGDVTVAPAATDDELLLELSSPSGRVLLWVDIALVDRFLDTTYELVPDGAECLHIAWDHELGAVLDQH